MIYVIPKKGHATGFSFKGKKKVGYRKRAHIWDGKDTLCKLWGKGVIPKQKYRHFPHTSGHQVCALCASEQQKPSQSKLSEYTREAVAYTGDQDTIPEDPRTTFAMLMCHGLNMKYKDSWARYQYKRIYDEWPPRIWSNDKSIEPNQAVKDDIEAERAAYYDRKQAEAQERAEMAIVNQAKKRF
jgi:hypothetical protein